MTAGTAASHAGVTSATQQTGAGGRHYGLLSKYIGRSQGVEATALVSRAS